MAKKKINIIKVIKARSLKVLNRAKSGFDEISAWRFLFHKFLLWVVISSPLFVFKYYGEIPVKGHAPKFLSNFLSSATNVAWVLIMPIVSSIIVAGFLCLISEKEIEKIAIDDAKRVPATVASIWFFIGVFLITLGNFGSFMVGFYAIMTALVFAIAHFMFW